MQVSPDLPCFLLGHSMGGLTVNTFLANNPMIASKLSGVIYSAPLLGIVKKQPLVLQKLISVLASQMNELIFVPDIQVHMISRNKQYVRDVLHQKKATALISLRLAHSFN